MTTTAKSGKKSKKQRSKGFAQAVLGMPSGVIQPRVKEVGPERFGIVSVDCAKARSKWFFSDFYGRVLIEPAVVEHRRGDLQQAIQTLKLAIQKHDIKDTIVCVEMTGTYHLVVVRAFRDAGFETRLVHPFASTHYRTAEHGDLKTDDHDLVGIFRAAVNGFGLVEQAWDETYRNLQLLVRHRRDLVRKRAKVQTQFRSHLERCLPGYAALFPDDALWQHQTGMTSRAVQQVLEGLFVAHGIPSHIRSDNGSEFIAKGLRDWLESSKVGPLYIEPGSPWENGYAESFHSKLRDEFLNREVFDSIRDAAAMGATWRRDYNEVRPHSSLGYRTPAEFARTCGPSAPASAAPQPALQAHTFPLQP